jgi:hypothetical protein
MVGKDLCLVERAGLDVSCLISTTYVESAQSQLVWHAICTMNLTKLQGNFSLANKVWDGIMSI